MFWVEGSNLATSTVKRARIDGTQVATVANSVNNPSDIAVDVVRDRLFWTSSGGSQIESASFTGSDWSIVYSSVSVDLLFSGLAVFEDYIYATVSGSNSIARINKFQRQGKEHDKMFV